MSKLFFFYLIIGDYKKVIATHMQPFWRFHAILKLLTFSLGLVLQTRRLGAQNAQKVQLLTYLCIYIVPIYPKTVYFLIVIKGYYHIGDQQRLR